MLFRVFPFLPGAEPSLEGGALYVARERQGPSRHDNPDSYGALYAARLPQSAIAEHIQRFRGQTLTDGDLERADGRRYALAAIEDGALEGLVDLDDPHELATRDLRPSAVATRRRATTRPIALSLFRQGFVGFQWWSTLEASWANVTLFAERAAPRLTLEAAPVPLSVELPELREAAELIGVSLP